MTYRCFMIGIFLIATAFPAQAQFDRFLKDLEKDLGIVKPQPSAMTKSSRV